MKMRTVFNAIGIAAILVGALLIAGVFFSIEFDFSKLNSETYKIGTFVHDAEDELNEIEINTTFFDVKIFPMDDEEKATIYFPHSENIRHEITWVDGKLSIKVVDGRKWYEKWSLAEVDTENTTIEVRLPHKDYEKLSVLVGSGDVSVTSKQNNEDVLSFSNVSVETGSGDIDFRAKVVSGEIPSHAGLSSGSGDVYLSGIQSGVPVSVATKSGVITLKDCVSTESFTLSSKSGHIKVVNVVSTYDKFIIANNDSGDVDMLHVMIGAMKVTVDTGDVELSDVVIQGAGLRPNSTLSGGELRIETDTGDVELKRSDAQSLFVTTDTGDVEIELLTGKYYSVKSDTGDVKHPEHDQHHGQCHVTTDTGDVEITVISK